MTLNCYESEFSEFHGISQIWEATTVNIMKIDHIVSNIM